MRKIFSFIIIFTMFVVNLYTQNEDDLFDIDVESNSAVKSTKATNKIKDENKAIKENSIENEENSTGEGEEEINMGDSMMQGMLLQSLEEEIKNLKNFSIKIKDGEYRLDMKSNNLTEFHNRAYWTINDWHSLYLGISARDEKRIDTYIQLAIFADKPASAEMNGKPYWYGTKTFGVYVLDKDTGEYKRPYNGLEKLQDDEVLGVNKHDMESAGFYDTDTVGIFIKKVDANIRSDYFDIHIFKNIGHKGWNDELFGLYWDNWLTEDYFRKGHLAPEGIEIKGKKYLSYFTFVMGEEPLFGEDPFVLGRAVIPINFFQLKFYHREILTDLKSEEGVMYLIPNVSPADYNNKVFIAIPASTNKLCGLFDADNRISAFQIEYKLKELSISGEIAKYKPAEKSLAYGGRLKTDLFSLIGIDASYKYNDIYAGNRKELSLSFNLRPYNNISFLINYKKIEPVSGEVEFLFPPLILDSETMTWINNRKRNEVEISLIYDPTPATWIKLWNIDETEKADVAFILTYKYFNYPTYTDYQEHFDYEWRIWWQEKHQDTINGVSVYTYGKYPYNGNHLNFKIIANALRPFKIVEDFDTGLKEAWVGSRYALTPFTINYTSKTKLYYKDILFTFLYAKDDWGPVYGSEEWGIKYDYYIRTSLTYKIGKSSIELYYEDALNNNTSHEEKIAGISPDISYKEIGTIFRLKF